MLCNFCPCFNDRWSHSKIIAVVVFTTFDLENDRWVGDAEEKNFYFFNFLWSVGQCGVINKEDRKFSPRVSSTITSCDKNKIKIILDRLFVIDNKHELRMIWNGILKKNSIRNVDFINVRNQRFWSGENEDLDFLSVSILNERKNRVFFIAYRKKSVFFLSNVWVLCNPRQKPHHH